MYNNIKTYVFFYELSSLETSIIMFYSRNSVTCNPMCLTIPMVKKNGVLCNL